MPTNDRSLKPIPVIFLAFANDRVDHSRYLRNLPKELRDIRFALDKAKDAGLCEIVERPNASVDDLLDIFQDKNFSDRIAIFHYGGHADCFKLLLESFNGARSPAFKEGLVSFLSRQMALKLVFLNACSSEQHALELKQAGIPAVIGTSQDINDEVAARLAARFYHGIANGLSLERAWRDAVDDIKINKDSSNFDALYHYSRQENHPDRFPWLFLFKDGAEKIKEWNLPDAVDDFLFGLPPIPRTFNLPEAPFLFLERFQRRHAEIFFGRSYYTRSLYHRVTDKNSPPIILLYGQSGVGKSSLLEAGLLPRLEESHHVIYVRRDPEKGLLGTLNKKFLEVSEPFYKKGLAAPTQEGPKGPSFGALIGAPGLPVISSECHRNNEKFLEVQKPFFKKVSGRRRQSDKLGDNWKDIETLTGKPLVVIVDQVEEVFNRSNRSFPNEFDDFLVELKPLFGNPGIYPRGKLILGYRKEVHPEIDRQLGNHELDRVSLFLQPLNRRDIIEIVTGLTCSQRLKDKYNIEVEDRLAEVMADDISEDRDTPAAPALQIILTRMWEASKGEDGSPVRRFTLERYQDLRKEGLLMEDFFKQQMEKLRDWDKEIVDSGLALDLLKFHTTEVGTACTRTNNEIGHMYFHRREIIAELVDRLKNFYLLTEGQGKDETGLAHDILAPVIIKEYHESDRPGQRAARILAARVRDFESRPGEVWLNETDLAMVEQGKQGMRVLTPGQERLVEESRNRKARRDRQIRKNKITRRVFIGVIVILVVAAGWLLRVAGERERIRKIDKAYYLVYLAQLKGEENPTVALRLLEAAWRLDKNHIVKETLNKIYRENTFYKILARQSHEVTSAAFSPSGRLILTGSTDNTARLWSRAGKPLQVFSGHKSSITAAVFSPDGRYILTGSLDKTARLWDLAGKPLQVLSGHESGVTAAAFSPEGRYIVTGSLDKTARLWDLQRNWHRVFAGHKNGITSIAYSPDGCCIVTGSLDKTVRLWNMQGSELKEMRGGEYAFYSVAFSPGGQYILAGADDGSVRMWNLRGEELLAFIGHSDRVNTAVFTPGPQYILTGSEDTTVRLWDLEGNEHRSFKGHEGAVTAAALSPDGRYLLTGSADKTIRLWRVHNPVGYFIGKGFGEGLSAEQKKEYGVEE